MGLMDGIMKNVLGQNPQAAKLLQGVSGLLEQNGGLQGLVQKFQANGLGEVVNSWVGKGNNLPVSASQLQSALGNETITKLASTMGVDSNQVTSQLSQHLPNLVDKLTPDGKLPTGNISMDNILSIGKNFLGK